MGSSQKVKASRISPLTFEALDPQTKALMEDRHFEELKEHYNEDEAAEIVAVIALCGFLNR